MSVIGCRISISLGDGTPPKHSLIEDIFNPDNGSTNKTYSTQSIEYFHALFRLGGRRDLEQKEGGREKTRLRAQVCACCDGNCCRWCWCCVHKATRKKYSFVFAFETNLPANKTMHGIGEEQVGFPDVAYESLAVAESKLGEDDQDGQRKKLKSKADDNGNVYLAWLKLFTIIVVIVAGFVALTLYLVVPILFRSWDSFQRAVVFLNHQHYDHLLTPNVNYQLNCVHSFYLNSTNVTAIGVWYIPPKASSLNDTDCPAETSMSQDTRLVVLYAHGNRGSRNSKTNLGNTKVFSNEMNAHVVSFDYRGFGDSVDVPPSVAGLTDDIDTVHRWVLDHNVQPHRILIWGHSLGSGVTLRHLNRLESRLNPKAAVLESPFTSFKDVIAEVPLARYFRFLPYFDYFFVDPIVNNELLNFDSVSQLPNVRVPLLVLHAEDDRVVPYRFGKRLCELAHQMQPKNVPPAVFVGFQRTQGYGHNRIHRNPQLPEIVGNFTEHVEKEALV